MTEIIRAARVWDYESQEITSFPSSGALAVSAAHGLGVRPRLFEVFARCLVADQDYTPGDEVKLGPGAGIIYGAKWANASSIGVSATNGFYIARKDGTTGFVLAAGTWAIVLRAKR